MAINVEKFADEVEAKIGAEEAQLVRDLRSKLGRYRTALERIIETWDGDSESMHDDPAEIAREALSDE